MHQTVSESHNCANCEHCWMRRIEVWCHLDKEVKPALRYTCNRWKQGATMGVLGAAGNVIYPIKSKDSQN